MTTVRDGAFVAFLTQLRARDLDALYGTSPWASLAVVRALDAVAKQIVLRLVYCAPTTTTTPDGGGGVHGIGADVLARWVMDTGDARGALERAMARLMRLRVVLEEDSNDARADAEGDVAAMEIDAGGGAFVGSSPAWAFSVNSTKTYSVHGAFAANVREALERGFVGLGEDGEDDEGLSSDAEVVSRVPDRATLNAYAKSKWEDLLLTLTGASDAFARSGSGAKGRLDAQALFRAAGLTTAAAASAAKKGGSKRLRNAGVTAAGFRFLLTTAQEQIWVLLTQYVRDSQSADATSAISFLLRLSFQRPGRAYAMTGTLSDTEQDVVRDLTHLGLLYTFDAKKKSYYVPTLLSSGLSGGGFAGDGDGGGSTESSNATAADGHIIVETNYRVYAYTSSAVEMEILRLFTRADYRLPNLYVGMLTRESVQNALRAGVDAEQIVGYIRAHAHKQVRRKKPSVPHTVCDQIRLWSRDMERVHAEACVLYCDFPQAGGFYDAVAKEASKRDGVLVWRDDLGRRLAVRADAHEGMKSVVAALKAKFA